MQAQDVAGLDMGRLLRQQPRQRLVVHEKLVLAECRQVDENAASLDAVLRHAVDAKRLRAGAGCRRAGRARNGPGRDDVRAGAEAVVEDHLGRAVAVGIEHLADMGEAVPLRRILQVDQRRVVADDVDVAGIDAFKREVEIGLLAAPGVAELRRVAARVDCVAARIVERQAEAERHAFADLGRGAAHALGRQQVEPAELIVRAELAPVGSGGTCFQRAMWPPSFGAALRLRRFAQLVFYGKA